MKAKTVTLSSTKMLTITDKLTVNNGRGGWFSREWNWSKYK